MCFIEIYPNEQFRLILVLQSAEPGLRRVQTLKLCYAEKIAYIEGVS